MQTVAAFFKKEFHAYLLSPTSYLAFAMFFLIVSYFVSVSFIGYQIADPSMIYSYFLTTFLFVSPLLTMRLLSEEWNKGTDELLYTAPIRLYTIVCGKYLASVTVLLLFIVVSLLYPMVMAYYGSIDWVEVLTGYLGMFLMSAALLSVGLFASSLSSHQMVSGIIAFGLMLLLWMIDYAGSYFMGDAKDILQQLSLFYHEQDFENGIIDTSHVAYFISVIFIFLTLTWKTMERKRWK